MELNPDIKGDLPALLSTGQIDKSTFGGVLEMDDNPNREICKEIINAFFAQAKQSLNGMDKAIGENNLEALSSHAFFLQDTSATIGARKVQEGCEKIEHLSKGRDEVGLELDPEQCRSSISKVLSDLNSDYAQVKLALRNFFGMESE